MGTIKATNIEPIADNGTVTLGSSGDTITVSTGVTVGGGMSNTPAFRATMSADQTCTNGSWNKAAFDTEEYDTNSAYNNSTYRFTCPSGFAGKYLFTAASCFYLDDTRRNAARFYKNGSEINKARVDVESASSNSITTLRLSAVITLAESDYVEFYVRQDNGDSRDLQSAYVDFSGHRLIGV